MTAAATRPRLVVIGAGITGLAAAYRAWEMAGDTIDLRVLEASDRVGGVIQTERNGDFLLEGGPDSMVTDKPSALELCKRLGLGDDLIPTQERFRRTLIVRDGRLHPMPDGFQLMAPSKLGPFLRSPILSWTGRLIALKDLVLPRGGPGEGGDESLASFVRRRLGKEILERIAQPMIGGIYTADPESLSLASTMPRFLEMEKDYRSVLLALAARARQLPHESATGPRYGIFASLREGIGSLIERLIERLPEGTVRRGMKVRQLTYSENKEFLPWEILLEDGASEHADAVVVATPAPRAATIVEHLDPVLGRDLKRVECASSAIVSLAYRRADVPRSPEAFGFVVPRIEGRNIIAGSFSHNKYAQRAPDDHVLLRIFVGGALQPEMLDCDDQALSQLVRQDLTDLLGVTKEPSFTRIHRWPSTMPQYYVGHARRIADLENRVSTHGGLALAGNAYHGVGLADCVRSGEEASERLLAYLREKAGAGRDPRGK